MAHYFVRRGEKVFGPVTGAQVVGLAKSGKVRATDEIATDKNGPWRPTTAMAPLKAAFGQTNVGPLGPVAADPLGIGPQYQTPEEGDEGVPLGKSRFDMDRATGGSYSASGSSREILEMELKDLRSGTVGDAMLHNKMATSATKAVYSGDEDGAGIYGAVMGASAARVETGLQRQNALEWLVDEKRFVPALVSNWGRAFPLLMLLLVSHLVAVAVAFVSPVGSLIIAGIADLIALGVSGTLRPLLGAILSYPDIRRSGARSFRESAAYLPVCLLLGLTVFGSYAFPVLLVAGGGDDAAVANSSSPPKKGSWGAWAESVGLSDLSREDWKIVGWVVLGITGVVLFLCLLAKAGINPFELISLITDNMD